MIANFLSFLSTIKTTIIASLLGLAIGFGFGWYEKTTHIAAEVTHEAKVVRIEDAKSVDKAQTQDAKLQEAQDTIRVQTKYITKEIYKYVPDTVHEDSQLSEETSKDVSACPSNVLSVGAVRLLNASRAGTPVDTSEWVDAEVHTPTEIGLQELSISDSEISEKYNELALKHDALVDSVKAYQEEQRKRLNK